ncbi:MAG: phosphoglycerate mutase family protein [Pseudomonadota bacterium]|nr:phosphoglycerate mutase family protein [Pseudomonadota bacterium]
MTVKGLLFALALVIFTALSATAADIYLVRHAEKVNDGSKDPDLTVLGRERAANLAVVLKSAAIEKIFSSDYMRTLETAGPLAKALDLEIELYDPRDLEPLAAQLLKLEDNALVVGHSNTTPELVDLTGGDGGTPIVEEWEYDRLYLLQTENGQVTRTIPYSREDE